MIWIVGGRGLLGSELAGLLARSGIDFMATGREVDILDEVGLARQAELVRPTWIVNCAAYTDVDGAEADPEAAYRLNALGVARLGKVATDWGASLLQLSTDYVFDGQLGQPCREDDPVSPLSVYGKTKAQGEDFARASCPRHVILRTAWLYGAGKANFVLRILGLLQEEAEIEVTDDQWGSPTWVADLARAILGICISPDPAFGTFHFAGVGGVTRYWQALAIQALAAARGLSVKDCLLRPARGKASQGKAPRPAYAALDSGKILKTYGIQAPAWQASLDRFSQTWVRHVRP